MRVLFVCTGNICRSPTAEGVFRAFLTKESIQGVTVASAGTHDYHVGEPPDRRAMAHALKRGYDLSAQRARHLQASDYEEFDLLLAMDSGHLEIMRRQCPQAHRHKLRLLLEFGDSAGDVPDPYYGGPDGFERVLDMVEAACRGLLAHARTGRRCPPGS